MKEWHNKTLEELIDVVLTVSRQRVFQQLTRYKKQGDEETVAKIMTAKKVASAYKTMLRCTNIIDEFERSK